MSNLPEINAKNVAVFVSIVIILAVFNFYTAIGIEGRVDRVEQRIVANEVESKGLKELLEEVKEENQRAHAQLRSMLSEIRREVKN